MCRRQLWCDVYRYNNDNIIIVIYRACARSATRWWRCRRNATDEGVYARYLYSITCTRYTYIRRRRRGDGRASGVVRVAPRRRDCRGRKPNSAMRRARMARTRRNDARRRYNIYMTFAPAAAAAAATTTTTTRTDAAAPARGHTSRGSISARAFGLLDGRRRPKWAGRARARVGGKSSGALCYRCGTPRAGGEWGHPRVLPAISCAR